MKRQKWEIIAGSHMKSMEKGETKTKTEQRSKKGKERRKTEAYKEKDEKTENATTSSAKTEYKHGSVHKVRGQEEECYYLQHQDGRKDTKAKNTGRVQRERREDGECYYLQREEGGKDTKSEKTRKRRQRKRTRQRMLPEDGRKDTKNEKHGSVHRIRRQEGKCYLQCALAFGAFHHQTALTLHLWRCSQQISAIEKK